MSGFPVVIVDKGGAPFVAVTSGAPVATVAASGVPITLVDSGAPALIVEGLDPGFSPLSLFAEGEQGGWYDPSDLSSMFQDTAGTTPAVVGQPVALIRDKSGRGNHATQATLASRPILRQDGARYYLEFDGVNDFFVTGSIGFTGTDEISVFAGIRKISDAAIGVIVELSTTSSNVGSFGLTAPAAAAAPSVRFRSFGSVGSNADSAGAFAAPITLVATGVAQITPPLVTLRINGVQSSTSAATQGVGNYGNYPLYIGRRGGVSLPFSGRIYGLVVRGSLPDAGQITETENWMNARTGAY